MVKTGEFWLGVATGASALDVLPAAGTERAAQDAKAAATMRLVTSVSIFSVCA